LESFPTNFGKGYKLDRLTHSEVDFRHLNRGVYQLDWIHLAEGWTIYKVQVWELTGKAAEKTPEQTIALDRNEVIQVNGGKLDATKAIKLGKYVGEEYMLSILAKRKIRTQAFVNARSFYLVRVEGTQDAVLVRTRSAFLGHSRSTVSGRRCD
jgi:hypothetical protein